MILWGLNPFAFRVHFQQMPAFRMWKLLLEIHEIPFLRKVAEQPLCNKTTLVWVMIMASTLDTLTMVNPNQRVDDHPYQPQGLFLTMANIFGTLDAPISQGPSRSHSRLPRQIAGDPQIPGFLAGRG